MICVVFRDGRCVPAVRCDHCGRLIENVHDGDAHWAADTRTLRRGVSDEVGLTHKRCSAAFEAVAPGAEWWAIELQAFLAQLDRPLEMAEPAGPAGSAISARHKPAATP